MITLIYDKYGKSDVILSEGIVMVGEVGIKMRLKVYYYCPHGEFDLYEIEEITIKRGKQRITYNIEHRPIVYYDFDDLIKYAQEVLYLFGEDDKRALKLLRYYGE